MRSSKRVTPMLPRSQNLARDSPVLSDSAAVFDRDLSSLPKTINYDIYGRKTAEQLLYEVGK